MRQFFHPSSFRIIQHFLESIHYDFVNSLNLTIPLGVSWGRVPIRNSQIIAISPEGFVIKLKSIVQDEGTRDPEPGDNVFSDKLFGISISDIHQGLGFNLFGQIVRADQQISFVPCCFREKADNIQAPLGKWPRAG